MAPALWFALVFGLLCLNPVLSDDQNCMNLATRDISVNVVSDNPNKILTFVRDDPGYTKNLGCKWKLKAGDYTKPRQMLLTVRNVDFDDQSATKEQCASSAVDVFTFSFSGQLTEGQVRSGRWCSNADVKAEQKLIMANLWNASNTLTVEFRSDNRETRPNAKGVEMDVVIMSEGYCHKEMLFHNGSCYLITETSLTLGEAQATARSVLGNVAAFLDDKAALEFLTSNKERGDVFPFKLAFALSSPVWTGCVKCKGLGILCADPSKNCKVVSSSITADSPAGEGRIAMHVVNDRPVFTCVNDRAKLPALIKFSQIGSNVRYPFVTCNPPVCREPGASSTASAEPPRPALVCPMVCIALAILAWLSSLLLVW